MCPGDARGRRAMSRSGVADACPLPGSKGVYAICFVLDRPVAVLSRGGRVVAEVGPGRVLYVGSAGGPGGIRARVGRHLAREKARRWWHVDWLTSESAGTLFVYYREGAYGPAAEDALASELLASGLARPVGMVGATDSSLPHTFYCLDPEGVARLLESRGGALVRCGQ